MPLERAEDLDWFRPALAQLPNAEAGRIFIFLFPTLAQVYQNLMGYLAGHPF